MVCAMWWCLAIICPAWGGGRVFRSCLLLMCVCFSWSWHVKANEPIRGSFRVFMSGSECAKVLVWHDLGGFDHLETVSRFFRIVGTLALEHVTLFFFLSNLVVQKCPRGFRPFHDLVLVNLWGEWGNGLPYFLYSLVQMTGNCSIVCHNQIGYL